MSGSESIDAKRETVYLFTHNMNDIFIWPDRYLMYIVCIDYKIG